MRSFFSNISTGHVEIIKDEKPKIVQCNKQKVQWLKTVEIA